MCGIVGAVSSKDIVPLLMEGLRRLEYRGYDSAGIAVLQNNYQVKRARAAGKVAALQALLTTSPLAGGVGIAHTRWATHGKPSEENAHPHMAGNVLLVHNGIVENYETLRQGLSPAARKALTSETDSEIVASVVNAKVEQGSDLLMAVKETVALLEGAFALCVMNVKEDNRIIGVCSGPPLVVGLSSDGHFLASDVLALQKEAEHFIYLEDGDIADISLKTVTIYDKTGKIVERRKHKADTNLDAADKAGYPHFMLKEIYEQPRAVQNTLTGCLSSGRVLEQIFGVDAKAAFDKTERIQIVACGTSFYAGLVARQWLEAIGGLPCEVEIASEFRYRTRVTEPNTLMICISQSGETADTLAALKSIEKEKYSATLSICNVANSSLTRESSLVFLTKAGPEIGVCSTKAFTTQLVALFLLSLVLGRRHHLKPELEKHYVHELQTLSDRIDTTLDMVGPIEEWAKFFAKKEHALFLGRGLQFPVALEGALKLKELSYIHAEAYPAGELKHGPLALVDKDMPIVALVAKDHLLEKVKSNLQEVRARHGELFILADKAFTMDKSEFIHVITMPEIDPMLAPIVYTVPLQLLAYHTAAIMGKDVDQPRNLAKSVTVE